MRAKEIYDAGELNQNHLSIRLHTDASEDTPLNMPLPHEIEGLHDAVCT